MNAFAVRSVILVLGLVAGGTAHAAVGRTPGAFVVGNDGSANYSIPLWTPPGVNGLKAQLALDYHSNRGNGLLGVGWAVRGLSAITRCRRTVAQDNAAGPIELSLNDKFCLDGQRLRLREGSAAYGQPGSTYRTEIESFARITAMGGSQGSGPAWFQVETKDGLIYEYGKTGDSRIEAGGGAVQTVMVWALNEIRDRSGNAVRFVYTEDTTNGTYRIAQIDYPYNTVYGGPYYQVVFTYDDNRPDVLHGYLAGYAWHEPNRLDQIDVQTSGGGTTLRSYDIGWESAPTTGRSRIVSIQECVEGDCLAASTLDYQDGTAGWSAETSTGVTVNTMADALPMDMNGDGAEDLVYPVSGGNFQVLIANGSGGYSGPHDTGQSSANPQTALPLDFNSDGKMDLLIQNGSGNWRLLTSGGQTFAVDDTVGNGGDSALVAAGAGGNAWIADYNGDGRPDLIYALGVGGSGSTLRGRLNTSGGYFSGTEHVLWSGDSTWRLDVTGETTSAFGSTQNRYRTDVRIADFDGDRRADLVVRLNYRWTPEWDPEWGIPPPDPVSLHFWQVMRSTGTSMQSTQDQVGGNVLLADLNGDGLTDVLYGASEPTSVWGVRYANGAGVLASANTTVPVGDFTKAKVSDVDGDGHTDIIISEGGVYKFARSTGNGFANPVSLSIYDTAAVANVKLTDLDRDGLSDWVYSDASGVVQVRLHGGNAARADLATSFSDGFGINYSPQYAPYAEGPGGAVSFPYRNWRGPLHVVDQVTASTGAGGTYTETYTYEGAILHLQGRGLQGFSKRTAHDSRNNLSRRLTLKTDFPYSGMVSQSELLQPIYPPIESTINTLQSHSFGTGNDVAYFPYVSAAVTEIANPNAYGSSHTKRTVTTVISSANYGTPTSVTVATEDRDSVLWQGQIFTTTVTNSDFINATSQWCVGRPATTKTTSTLPGGASDTRTTVMTFDDELSLCRVETRTTQPETLPPNDPTLEVATTYGYDSCGNVTSEAVVGRNPNGSVMTPRISETYFGTRCQLPEWTENALNQRTNIVNDYNRGLPLTVTDPNGLPVEYSYDTFGRPDVTTRPDDTATDTNFDVCDSNNNYCDTYESDLRWKRRTIQLDTSGTGTIRDELTYYDGLNRPRYIYTQLAGGAYSTIVRTYDALGRLEREYVPSTTGLGGYRQFSYDVLGRVLADGLYDQYGSLYRQTTFSRWGRRVTATDPPSNGVSGNQKVDRYYDVRGKLRLVREFGATPTGAGYAETNYDYDPFGNLSSIIDAKDAGWQNSTTSWFYNLNGHLTAISHPDRGNWTYSPNSLGELASQTDAKMQSMSMTYDLLGRPLTRTEQEGPTTWTWGTDPNLHEIGRLRTVSGGGYSETYAYDVKGRLAQTTINADTTYDIIYDYDGLTGLPDSLTYPVSTPGGPLRIKYGYDHGVLSQVSNYNAPSTIFWQLNTVDALGNAMDESLGTTSPVGVISSFDPLTGLIESRTAGTDMGLINRQNLAFEWDLNGNLKKRTDNNQGGLYEEFFYDPGNRLDYSQRNGVTNLNLSYAENGSLSGRTEGGVSYEYQYASRPHAVTKLRYNCSCGVCLEDNYDYDANGNMTSRPGGGAVSWYTYNLPNTITQDTYSSQFFYTPDRRRWKQVADYAGADVETTIYIGGVMEKVTRGGGLVTEYKHYIPAGASSMAIHTRRDIGTNSTYYVTRDHLGSSTAVMNNAGNLMVNLSFAAFGSRRGSAWQDGPSQDDWDKITSTTRRGFTGHEHLDSVSLVHMNGRVYDPKIGRFLSADPVLGDLGSPQSLNPYSYVGNNPLTLTDPTGLYSMREPFFASTVDLIANGALLDLDIAIENYQDSFSEWLSGCRAALALCDGAAVPMPTEVTAAATSAVRASTAVMHMINDDLTTREQQREAALNLWYQQAEAGMKVAREARQSRAFWAFVSGLSASWQNGEGGSFTNETPSEIARLRSDGSSGLAAAEARTWMNWIRTGKESGFVGFKSGSQDTLRYVYFSGDTEYGIPNNRVTRAVGSARSGESVFMLQHTHPPWSNFFCISRCYQRGPSGSDRSWANTLPEAFHVIHETYPAGLGDGFIYYGQRVGH